MTRHAEVAGGRGRSNVVVVDTQGLARMFDHDGELIARAPIRYSFGGRRLWSGTIDGAQLTVGGDWDRGVAAYVDGLTAVAWDHPEIARPQRIRSADRAIAVSTEDGGVWLLDPDGRIRARDPQLDEFLCDAVGVGLAVADGRLVLVSTDDLRVIAPVRTAEFLPVCAVQLRDGFAVGTFGERVVAVGTNGNERFVHRLARREIARALLQPPGSAGLVMIVRDTRAHACGSPPSTPTVPNSTPSTSRS